MKLYVKETEVDTQRRDRKLVHSQPSAKRVNPVDSRLGGKGHEGTCRATMVCYLCGKEGHNAKDYLKGLQVHFSYNHAIHVKAECPLLASRLVQTPVPATLDIIDSYHGKVEASKAHNRAFQLTTEEAKTTPDVVGMCLFTFLLSYLMYMLMLCSS